MYSHYSHSMDSLSKGIVVQSRPPEFPGLPQSPGFRTQFGNPSFLNGQDALLSINGENDFVSFRRESAMRKVVLALAVLFTFSPALFAQQSAWANKLFAETTHDFGVVARGAQLKHSFKITNIYKEPL